MQHAAKTASLLQFLNYRSIQITGLRDSSVGILTKLRIGRSLFRSRKKCYLFSNTSRPALGPNVYRSTLLGREGGRNVTHSIPHCLVPGLGMGGARSLWRAQGQIYL